MILLAAILLCGLEIFSFSVVSVSCFCAIIYFWRIKYYNSLLPELNLVDYFDSQKIRSAVRLWHNPSLFTADD